MRPDPALQARSSSRFTLLRALVAALVLAALALLPAICRGTCHENRGGLLSGPLPRTMTASLLPGILPERNPDFLEP